jgi:hypothetical protein
MMSMRSALPLLAFLVALSACASLDRKESWPTLAPRAGELSPLVPRTPLGACAGCGQDAAALPPPPPPAPPPPVPADVPARLARIGAAIAGIEAAAPARRADWQRAAAAATGKPADSDAMTEAEVQRSRYEALLLPLGIEARALDAIEDDLAGKADAAAGLAGVAALRARITALDVPR